MWRAFLPLQSTLLGKVTEIYIKKIACGFTANTQSTNPGITTIRTFHQNLGYNYSVKMNCFFADAQLLRVFIYSELTESLVVFSGGGEGRGKKGEGKRVKGREKKEKGKGKGKRGREKKTMAAIGEIKS